jgi:hypothetical protein
MFVSSDDDEGCFVSIYEILIFVNLIFLNNKSDVV